MRVITFLFFGVLFVTITGLSGCATWNAERNAPMVGEWIDVGGERMHAFSAGPRDGDLPPVVLIHGASANLRDMQMSLGEPLSRDRFVVMVDRLGRGYSDRPKDGYALDVQARYIHDVVNAYGLKNPLIVGQSLGGAVALNYALQYQEEMSGLVLLAPVSHEWPGGIAWYNSASQIPVLGFLLRRLVIPVYGQLAAEDGIEETFLPDAAPNNYYQRSGLALLFRPGDFKSNAADIAHLKQEIIRQQDRYGELQLPVAIMTGTSDSTVSPEIHSKTLVTQVDGATLTLFPETGHALHHSQTEKIIETIDQLSSADAAAR